MWSDRLRTTEVHRTERAISDLSTVSWANPLLSRLDKAGGIKPENMPLMFEVRFAQELHHAGHHLPVVRLPVPVVSQWNQGQVLMRPQNFFGPDRTCLHADKPDPDYSV